MIALKLSLLQLAQWIQLQVDSPVIELQSIQEFRHKVLGSDDVWLVDFFHPRCGPCNAIKGTVRRTASKLKGIAKVAMFNCVESDETQAFCTEQGVSGYPTILAYGAGANKRPTVCSNRIERLISWFCSQLTDFVSVVSNLSFFSPLLYWLPQQMTPMRICLVSDSKVTVYTHIHSLSLVLVVMMSSKEFNTARSIRMLIF